MNTEIDFDENVIARMLREVNEMGADPTAHSQKREWTLDDLGRQIASLDRRVVDVQETLAEILRKLSTMG